MTRRTTFLAARLLAVVPAKLFTLAITPAASVEAPSPPPPCECPAGTEWTVDAVNTGCNWPCSTYYSCCQSRQNPSVAQCFFSMCRAPALMPGMLEPPPSASPSPPPPSPAPGTLEPSPPPPSASLSPPPPPCRRRRRRRRRAGQHNAHPYDRAADLLPHAVRRPHRPPHLPALDCGEGDGPAAALVSRSEARRCERERRLTHRIRIPPKQNSHAAATPAPRSPLN